MGVGKVRGECGWSHKRDLWVKVGAGYLREVV